MTRRPSGPFLSPLGAAIAAVVVAVTFPIARNRLGDQGLGSELALVLAFLAAFVVLGAGVTRELDARSSRRGRGR